MGTCNIVLKSSQKNIEIELQMYGHLLCQPAWGQVDHLAYHRVYYVYGGEAYCDLEGEVYPLRPGYLYMFPVNREYSLRHNPDDPLECTFLHIHIMPLIVNTIEEIKVEEGSLLWYQLLAIHQLIDQGYPESTLLMQTAVLLDILGESIKFTYMTNEVILRSVMMIQERYSEKLTNTMLAESFGYNTNYYIKVFTKYMGISPGIYLSKYRLRMAIYFLLNDTPIKEVAELVGYEDSKAFARFFKKHTSVPPSNYKKYYVLTV